MKLMEIFELRLKCLGAVNPKFKRAKNLRTIVNISHAAQEYYTSGMLTHDAIYEMKNTQTHPYLYDGRPTPNPGEDKISKKYGLNKTMIYHMVCLAMALETDIKNGVVNRNGTVDFAHVDRSRVLMQYHVVPENGRPIDGLPAVMQQMLALYRGNGRGK